MSASIWRVSRVCVTNRPLSAECFAEVLASGREDEPMRFELPAFAGDLAVGELAGLEKPKLVSYDLVTAMTGRNLD